MDPEQLRADLERMVELERARLRGDPHQETKVWLEKLAEVDRERRGYHRLAAKGRMTDEELGKVLAELDKTRETAERELAAMRGHQEHLEALERDKHAFLESYAGMAPEALESLTPEERYQVYKLLKVRVVAHANGALEVSGALAGPVGGSNAETVSSCRLSTASPEAGW